MGRPKKAYDYINALKLITNSGMTDDPPPNESREVDDTIPTLEERVKSILGLVNTKERNAANMLFFVMYDIESNKVRRYIVKYLERKGCTRVQKSIFLADLPISSFNEIKNDLAEVQAAYDNQDSILVVPISTELLKSMKIIGQNIDIDIITRTKSTLFF